LNKKKYDKIMVKGAISGFSFFVFLLMLSLPFAYADDDDNDFNLYGNLTSFDNSTLEIDTDSGTLLIPLDNDFEVDDYEGSDILNYTNSNLIDQYVELKVECENNVLYASEIEQQDFDDDYDLYGLLTAFNATSISIDNVPYGITDDFEFEIPGEKDDYDYDYTDSTIFNLVNGTLLNQTVEVEIEPEDGNLLAEDMELAEIVLCPYQYVVNVSDNITINDTSNVITNPPTDIILLDNHFELDNDSMDLSLMELSAPVTTVNATIQNIGTTNVELKQEFEFNTKNGTGVTLTNSNMPNVEVKIPESTKVLATEEWMHFIFPPTESSSTNDVIPPGFELPENVMMVGSYDSVLVFDKAVTIFLYEVTGQMGYKLSGEITWNLIDTCAGTYENPTEPIHPNECSISNGVDTKILTYHFTEFGSFEESLPPPVPVETTPTEKKNSSGSKNNKNPKPYPKVDDNEPISKNRIKKWIQEDERNIPYAINEFIIQGFVDDANIPSVIPDWIKNIMDFWIDGGISDEELFESINYLLDNKIIH
jgi:hypothetical protein